MYGTVPEPGVSIFIAAAVLDPDHVATTDLQSPTAAVAGARIFASDVLTGGGLEDLSFTTELIVSGLVTDANRYGKPSVQLRLILQSTLTCEVFDAGSTTRICAVPVPPTREAADCSWTPSSPNAADRSAGASAHRVRRGLSDLVLSPELVQEGHDSVQVVQMTESIPGGLDGVRVS
ncbi:hypothetical protein GCM10010216_62960 [Streptomyces flaveolus]|nr:hypothetical protein GCM10010216_62960 [Streptomyces flaveolus]